MFHSKVVSAGRREIYTRETHEFIVCRLICAVPLTRMFFLPHKSSTRPRNTKTFSIPRSFKETDPIRSEECNHLPRTPLLSSRREFLTAQL